jgi:hypothetical protein
MSIKDTIAQRRLAEDFCKRWATCLVSSITDASLREWSPLPGVSLSEGVLIHSIGQHRWVEQHRRR